MTNTNTINQAAREFFANYSAVYRTDKVEFLKPRDKRYRLDLSRRVAVYRNLQGNCWSLQQDGLVKAYAQDVVLEDCKWTVQPAGNRWVRENGRKKVHAFVRGYIRPVAIKSDWSPMAVTYNPYKMQSFCFDDTPAGYWEIDKSDAAFLSIGSQRDSVTALFSMCGKEAGQ
jgi:hypothetical protein